MSKHKPTAPHLDGGQYGEILRQAFNQIGTARFVIAKQVNSSTQSVY